jgi:hypothetical protein
METNPRNTCGSSRLLHIFRRAVRAITVGEMQRIRAGEQSVSIAAIARFVATGESVAVSVAVSERSRQTASTCGLPNMAVSRLRTTALVPASVAVNSTAVAAYALCRQGQSLWKWSAVAIQNLANSEGAVAEEIPLPMSQPRPCVRCNRYNPVVQHKRRIPASGPRPPPIRGHLKRLTAHQRGSAIVSASASGVKS